jgi:hypothetical protein
MPRFAATSTDAAQDAASRPRKKRRRDWEQAFASNGAASATTVDAQDHQPQRANTSIPSPADGAPDETQAARKRKKERKQQQASANAGAAPQRVAEVPDGLADAGIAKTQKRDEQKLKKKRTAIVRAEGQLLPNGVHGLAKEQPTATAALAAARADAVAGRAALQNGMDHHLDASPRIKQKMKRKKAASRETPALAASA